MTDVSEEAAVHTGTAASMTDDELDDVVTEVYRRVVWMLARAIWFGVAIAAAALWFLGGMRP